MLEGRWTTIAAAGSTIAIGGTSAPWGPAIDPRAIPPADLRILLSHSPDLFYKAQRLGSRPDVLGPQSRRADPAAAGRGSLRAEPYSRRFDRGFFRARRTLLYVNEGIAGMHPVRYGCYPEISRFVLRPGCALGRSGFSLTQG